jgi:hypothetical protein
VFSSPRPRLGFSLVVFVALAWAALTGVFGGGSAITGKPAASPAAAEASPTAPAPERFFGFTPDLGGVDDTALNAYYRQIKSSGASWVRFGVYWWYIEKTPGDYTWYSTDRYFAAAACNGLAILPMFIGSPQWASGRSSTIAPPLREHFPKFQAMIRAVVARYGEGGAYWRENHNCVGTDTPVPDAPAHLWQIWNEPNIMTYWGGDETATARGYGRLLSAADEAIDTSANPHAPTVLGGLTGSKAPEFLATLYDVVPNLNADVDVFDLHAYAMNPQASLDLLRRVRATADAHGADRKVIWVSEVAWSSCRHSPSSYPSRCVNNNLAHDESEQRNYLKDLYELLLAHSSGLRLRRVAWYSFRDPSATRGTCNFCYGSGLLRRDGTPKPAWSAYVSLSRSRP